MDHIDKQILFHLQNQARISMTELGKCVGLSQPAVTERVRRMEEKGIISEYRTIISLKRLENMLLPTCYFILGIVMHSLISAAQVLMSSNVTV